MTFLLYFSDSDRFLHNYVNPLEVKNFYKSLAENQKLNKFNIKSKVLSERDVTPASLHSYESSF